MHDASFRNLYETRAVHIWQGEVPSAPDPRAFALLSAEERANAACRSGPVGTWYAHVHAETRRILARYLDADPRELRLGRWPCPRCPDPAHGRPRIVFPRTELDFNLSRSGPHWLLAVAAERPVGVDLETARVMDALLSTAALTMTRAELSHLTRLPEGEARTALFYRAWTRKEAVVKASGVGVVADLRAIDVLPHLPDPVTVRHVEPNGPGLWVVRDLPIGPGRHAALAREPGRTGPVLLTGTAGPGAFMTGRPEPLTPVPDRVAVGPAGPADG